MAPGKGGSVLFKIIHDRMIGVDKGEYSDYKVHIKSEIWEGSWKWLWYWFSIQLMRYNSSPNRRNDVLDQSSCVLYSSLGLSTLTQ